MNDAPVEVVVHRRRLPLAAGLDALWNDILGREWLAPRSSRIVIQVGWRWRSPLTIQTARSLAARLAVDLPQTRVDVVDGPPDADGPAAGGSPALTAADGALSVTGTVARSLRLPTAWFDDCFLVTITGIGPDSAVRFSAVLDAQAEPLRPYNPAAPSATLAYEAHRLFASDLVVACAQANRDDPCSDACWFAGRSDLAVEMALARACGCEPAEMPSLMMLARHEILPAVALDAVTSMLSGYVAPAWQARMHAARTRFATSRHAIVQDLVAVRRNLNRIPPAIHRRLAARKRGAG